jgi:hypothetical protein
VAVQEVVHLKRYLFAILCALILGGTSAQLARANPQVYDVPPSDGRPSVGDDDEPLVTAPLVPVGEAVQTRAPTSQRHTNVESSLGWIGHGTERARVLLLALANRILIFPAERAQR